MRIEIENSIIECLGNPTEKSISGSTHYLDYFKVGQCKLSFIISNNRLSFLLDDTGPILEDKNVKTVKEIKELLKEIIVILKNPITQTAYLIDKDVKKTKFLYSSLLGDSVTQLTYIGGKYNLCQLFQKKDCIKIIHKPWIK